MRLRYPTSRAQHVRAPRDEIYRSLGRAVQITSFILKNCRDCTWYPIRILIVKISHAFAKVWWINKRTVFGRALLLPMARIAFSYKSPSRNSFSSTNSSTKSASGRPRTVADGASHGRATRTHTDVCIALSTSAGSTSAVPGTCTPSAGASATAAGQPTRATDYHPCPLKGTSGEINVGH